MRHFDYQNDTDNISLRYKRNLTVFVVHIIVKRFQNNQPPLTVDDIVSEYKLPIRLLNQILTSLTDANIIAATENDKAVKAYLPAIDINGLSLNMVEQKLDTQGSELFLESKNEEMDAFWKEIITLQEKSHELSQSVLIKDM